ncbi:fasciclin domain-containing protein [Pedobacter sp. P351]|uniref:fasciclin domain-containing protein n=1 Tax=Pedobacter superstes TaxID=3133441 RepID=UPI0030AF830D
MENILAHKWIKAPIMLLALLLVGLTGCKKEPIISVVSNQVNITGYLDKNPDQFSEFRKILDLTGNAGYLQAYGNYTMFLPTNEGVKKFLEDNGKTSVDQVDLQELKNIVRFHLIEDTVATTDFGDGKLPALTMFGQYLVTGASNVGGSTQITINRQANLEESNIRLGNGYVHVIDYVLTPAKLTLAQSIEANPNFSIFTQALKETGLYDTLNILPVNNTDPAQKFLTVLVESDQVLAAAGFNSYAALKAKYNTGVADMKSHLNGMHAFMAYHILYNAKYLADIVSAQGHITLANPEVISSKLVNQQVVINDIDFNGSYEPGFTLNRDASDVSASNGVLHLTAPYAPASTAATTGHFMIKVRSPFPVYWDVADFPESRALLSVFRKSGTFTWRKSSASAPSPIKDWWWPKTGDGVTYNNDASYVFKDYLNLFLGNQSGNARQEFIQMKSPLIVRGRYNVWVCYRRQNQSGRWPTSIGTEARLVIDGDPTIKSFYFAEPPPTGSTNELESLGWKYYTSNGNAAAPFLKATFTSNGETSNSPWVAKSLGVVTIKSTDVHTVVIQAIRGTQSTNNLDMIQFIPVDYQSQILPRFMPDGTEDWTNYPGTH